MSRSSDREIARAARSRRIRSRGFRARFHMPPPRRGEAVYLCGNSLGLQPRDARALVEEDARGLAPSRRARATSRRATRGCPITSSRPRDMARLVGAKPHRSRLHELAHREPAPDDGELLSADARTASHPDRGRRVPVRSLRRRVAAALPRLRSARGADRARGAACPASKPAHRGPRCADRARARHARAGAAAGRAVLHRRGHSTWSASRASRAPAACRVGLDLAHAVGNVPLAAARVGRRFRRLVQLQVPQCRPGRGRRLLRARASCARRRTGRASRAGGDTTRPRASRWAPTSSRSPGAEGWQLSNPPIFSFAPLLASLEIFAGSGHGALRAKSLQLSGLPRDAARRTCSASTWTSSRRSRPHSAAASCRCACAPARRGRKRVHADSRRRDIVCDWREPDVIRVAPVPLYNRFDRRARLRRILGAALRSSPSTRADVQHAPVARHSRRRRTCGLAAGYLRGASRLQADVATSGGRTCAAISIAAGRSINLALADRGLPRSRAWRAGGRERH